MLQKSKVTHKMFVPCKVYSIDVKFTSRRSAPSNGSMVSYSECVPCTIYRLFTDATHEGPSTECECKIRSIVVILSLTIRVKGILV